MPLTLSDITPIGLCIATQELFDAKRFQANFCDHTILRTRDPKLEPKLTKLKRELNSMMTEKKFLEGHKTAIISNIDKIISLVYSRYAQIDYITVENIVLNARELIDKILFLNSFDEIAKLESVFKSKVTLPVYSLFIAYMKKSNVKVV